jgi:2-methylcitrate dehydratase PrpD
VPVNISASLAGFLAQSRWDDVPQAVRREAKRALLDVSGCLVAGLRQPETKKLAGCDPALLYGFAANILDFDDTHLRTVIHSTTPVGAALFALAQKSRVSGQQLLHAFVLGIETSCRIGNAVSPGHYEKGWHITSTCGVFGAAASAGKALGLNPEQTLSALGLAATQACGLVETMGSMAKSLNGGFAARNGLLAAELAARDFEGPAQPIEGARGFVRVFGVNQDFDAIVKDLGKTWSLPDIAYKPYPCGVVLHALIDGCLELRPDAPAENVERIFVSLHPLAIERGDRPAPRTGIESKLSAQHVAAAALVRGRAGVEEFTDAALTDPRIASLRSRVEIRSEPRLPKAAALVEIRLKDGSVLKLDVAYARGTVERPLSDAELEAKFRGLAGAKADALLALLLDLESLDDAGRLARALTAP